MTGNTETNTETSTETSPLATSDRRPLLELRGVGKRYGSVTALSDVDMMVHAGEVVALVGDNGAGKSTLVKAISGSHQIDSGVIAVDGEPAHIGSPSDAARHGIETVYQDLALCDNLDVVANLFLGREERRGPFRRFLAAGTMRRRAEQVIKELAVTLPSLDRPVASLSGGQRQAVAVCRAVLWGSRLVLLDEPTAALGVEQTAMVHRLVRGLRERGLGVLVISHNLSDVFAIADRIVVLRLGTVAGAFDPKRDSVDTVVSAITGGNVVAGAGVA
jgi:D-xylose transport system ATP-binding protein